MLKLLKQKVQYLVSSLATNSALTVIEKKKYLLLIIQSKKKKKKDYDAKISGIESKYITTGDYNKITKNIVDCS